MPGSCGAVAIFPRRPALATRCTHGDGAGRIRRVTVGMSCGLHEEEFNLDADGEFYVAGGPWWTPTVA